MTTREKKNSQPSTRRIETMKKQDQRNLNPRPPAVFAMYHWPADYGAQSGGSMDFFDRLHPADQKYCHDAVTGIVGACLNWGVRLQAGKETAPKATPQLKRRRKR